MNLNDKRKLLELSRITLSKHEQEFRIEELKEEIKRIETNLKIQIDAIEKLTNQINNKDVKDV
jgi:Asp-tRNA(Asn)/Glu-tRNA(Gln) amidotransferase C subunit